MMRFYQKIDLRTIFLVQKLRAMGVLFALMWRTQNNIFLDSFGRNMLSFYANRP